MSCSTCPAKALLNNNSPEDLPQNDINCGKLNTYDWLDDIPSDGNEIKLMEVRFKNTRKDFYINEGNLKVKRGDYVAVEANRGHDIGQITLTGKLAEMQLKKKNLKEPPKLKIYRKANESDIEKWHKARLREKPVLIKSRQLASSLNLEMKISDVEFQGDGSRAIFYYIADGRVDFRELIKLYAKEFNTRIEMKQIGSRQEAALVGGIGSCGKELCCSSWRTNLSTVITNAARIQELSHNAQKLTGQCGKLKCCLMYELDNYLEAQNEFPDILLELETDKGIAYPKKKDILKKVIYYAVGNESSSKHIAVDLERVKEIIQLNKRGIKVKKLSEVELATDLDFVSYQEKELPKPQQSKKKPKFKKRKPRRNINM
jgi:cell fate regulator YaaT (PSP1 superfamily)